eukprot:gnl/TRDRNA2_/TRDRNA2_207248_c0_seq1.p1 gnl/TRDRNA2_/TRDRNA2_207248_c0~~gnl/TRDRNA2_/TRDRNA2_207248_c0_seq1.p1  ORF type:complete len:251 (-),score=27.84 gnl/TRDRNA2_/TRDRNA2_207248_c0_seq1:16-768(-)
MSSSMPPVSEHPCLNRDRLCDFMMCQGGDKDGTVSVKGVATYLYGLLWCLETYTSGTCPDFHYRFPLSLASCASAPLIAEHAPHLDPACFEAARGASQPLGPLACAVAVLPVAEVRSLVLPSAPCLAPLLDGTCGLLAEVARLESCRECGRLAAIADGCPPGSKKAVKHRKALEVHLRGHKDIDTVPMDALDAEVRRLCSESGQDERLVVCLAADVTMQSPRAPETGKRLQDETELPPAKRSRGKRGSEA